MDKQGKVATTARRLGQRLRKPALTLVATALTLMLAEAQQAVMFEYQVTTAAIPDYEFDSARWGKFCQACNYGKGNSRLVFADANNGLWVGYVDFQTGDFVPPDGHGEQIDTNAAAATDYGNGPEWTDGAAGSSFTYTRYAPGLPHSDATATVAVATQGPNGWTITVPANSTSTASPAGTLDHNDPDPRFNYVNTAKTGWFWRKYSQMDVEHVLPLSQISNGNARRWVPGTHKIMFQGHPPNDPTLLRDQVYTYDTDSGELEQLTNNQQGVLGGMMWQAPEFNNEFAFFTMEKFRQQILVYRKLPGADRVLRWTIVKTIKAPSALPFIWSPEVFTHNGRSYIFFQVSSSSAFFDLTIPNQLAISGVDPLVPDFRLITNDTSTPRVRIDPEFFITARGPFIYYNRLVPQTATTPAINDGVWRVDLGLGPPH